MTGKHSYWVDVIAGLFILGVLGLVMIYVASGCGPIHIHISPSHFHYDQPVLEDEEGTVTIDIGGQT